MNIIFAAVIGFMIIGVYFLITPKGRADASLIQSIPILSILMSVIMRIDSSKAVMFFGIFGVLSLIRYRSTLSDQTGIAFILFSVIMGLLAGVGSFILAIVSFIIITLAIIIVRTAFISTKQHAALISFSGNEELDSIQNKASQILASFNCEFGIYSYKDRENKLGTTIKEVVFLIRTKKEIELIELYSKLQPLGETETLKVTIESMQNIN